MTAPAAGVVPYIASWTEEPLRFPPVRAQGDRLGSHLAFRDEKPYDRDGRGVLWARQAIARGRGTPRFEAVHTLRQRRALRHLLCQVCGRSTLEADDGRHLFVLRDVGRPVAEGERTTAPPVCLPCARTSVRACPTLRAGYVAVRARQVLTWGVAAVRYSPRTLRPVPDADLVEMAYPDPAVRWAVAVRKVVTLHGCTPVDLARTAGTG